MTRSSVIRTAALSAALLSTVAGCGDDSETNVVTQAAPEAFDAVPDIEADPPTGLERVFLGGDATGSVSIAIAETPDGKLVAYFCDGVETGTWFSAASFGEEGTVRTEEDYFAFFVDGDRLSGTGRVADQDLEFTLALAEDDEGLFRTTEDGVTSGWIFTDGGGTVRGTAEDGGGATTFGIVGDYFGRRRCAKIVLKYSQNQYQILFGTAEASNAASAAAPGIREDFRDNSCGDYGYALTT